MLLRETAIFSKSDEISGSTDRGCLSANTPKELRQNSSEPKRDGAARIERGELPGVGGIVSYITSNMLGGASTVGLSANLLTRHSRRRLFWVLLSITFRTDQKDFEISSGMPCTTARKGAMVILVQRAGVISVDKVM